MGIPGTPDVTFQSEGLSLGSRMGGILLEEGGGCYTGCALTGTQLESGPALTRQLNGRGDADGHEEIRRGIA